MIAVDTSSLRRFLEGQEGADVVAVAQSIEARQMTLPPIVLTEILSEPRLQRSTIEALSAIPLLEIFDGCWMRAGVLRAKVIAAGHKSKIADAVIAQICIDHDILLITNDRDFRHYEKFGLRLA